MLVAAHAMKTPHKYFLYEHAVQEPEVEAHFMNGLYKRRNGRPPVRLREDFCGTFKLCCEWLKLKGEREAIGVDLDPEPIAYGKATHLPQLPKDRQRKIKIVRGNVMHVTQPKVDVIAAFNFSYYIFKQRNDLLRYFKACHKSLRPGGMMVLDAVGGTEMMEDNLERRRARVGKFKYTYVWEQTHYNVIDHSAEYYIHFELDNGRKIKRAFHYDWRMWGIPEVLDVMADAGFKEGLVYWEGVDSKGSGNGIFRQQKYDDQCEVWIAYLVGIK